MSGPQTAGKAANRAEHAAWLAALQRKGRRAIRRRASLAVAADFAQNSFRF
jgi:hypothetical protein